MNGIELIELIKQQLKINSELYRINIISDPYEKIEELVPCILIDYGKSRLKTASKGEIIGYYHSLDFYCIVSAQNKKHEIYKKEAIELAEKFIRAFNLINSSEIRVVQKGDSFEPQELMIGSLKCSAILINKEIETRI